MSTSPRHLLRLRDYWVARGGVHLGIVGSMASHCRGYHLGRDRIYGPVACRRGGVPRPGQGDADYSVLTARDRAGLSNAASAIDLGRLGGSLPELYRFSRWLVERCRANAPGTDAIREVIYSPDGRTVLRWDRERGHTSAPRSGEGDNSHLTHTHISFYRDSEGRDKRPLFAPYFVAEEEGMNFRSYTPGHVTTVRPGAPIHGAPSDTSPRIRVVPAGAGEPWTIMGLVRATAGADLWAVRWGNGRLEFANSDQCSPPAPPATADAAAAAAAERARWDAWLATRPQ